MKPRTTEPNLTKITRKNEDARSVGRPECRLRNAPGARTRIIAGLRARKETGTSTSPPVMLHSPLELDEKKSGFFFSRCVLV